MFDNALQGMGRDAIVGLVIYLVGIVFLLNVILRRRRSTMQEVVTDTNASGERREARSDRSEQKDCPICLCDLSNEIETNCGHRFCGACILQYWERAGRSAILCPTCRADLHMLHDCMPPPSEEAGSPTVATDDGATISRRIADFNSRHAGGRSFRHIIEDAPVLLRRLWEDISSGDMRLLRPLLTHVMYSYRVLVLVGTLLYILSPWDAVPAYIFGVLGYLDDLLVFLFLVAYASGIYRAVVLARRGHGGQAAAPVQN